MAYVRNTNDELDEETGLINPSISGTSSGEVTANSQQTAGAPSSNPNAQKAAAGGFTNLQKYLNANTGGAQQLGTRIATDLNTARDTATTGLSDAASTFGTKVAEGTNIFNTELASNAANDASSYLDNADLQRQLSGQYSGPSSFVGSEEDTTARKGLQTAQEKQAMAGTESGRTQILRNVLNVPGVKQTSRGGLNLNQFLVQQNEPAWNTVKTASDNITPLTTQFANTATDVQNSIKNARDTNLATKQSVLNRLAQGSTDLQSQINQQLAARQLEADNMFALGNYASINDTGLTADQIQAFNALNDETIAQGGTGVNFRDYLIAGTPKIYGTKDVATAPQVEDLNALARLRQIDNTFLQGGVEGSGASLDYMRAVSELIRQQNAAAGGTGTGPTNPYGPGYTGPVAGTVGGTLGSTTLPTTGTGGGQSEGPPGNDVTSGGTGFGTGTGGSTGSGFSIGGITINDQGVAVANTTGLSDKQASALGSILGAFFGVPALGMIGSKANAAINTSAQNTATGANIAMQDTNPNFNGSMNTPGSAATSGPTGTGGIAANAGEAAAAAAQAAGMPDAAIGAAAQAAADAARAGADAATAAAAGAAAADAAAIAGGALTSGSDAAAMDAHDAEGLAAADAASAALDAGAPSGGGGGGDKIICTAMNDAYGLPYKENRIWVRYSRLHMAPEHQVGYHKVFLPLVKYAYHSGPGWTNTQVRKVLEWIALNRTSDIKNELAGAKRNPVHKFLRSIAEPILYWIGKGLK